ADVVREIARAFHSRMTAPALDQRVDYSGLMRLSAVVQAMAPQLDGYDVLVDYAREVSGVLADPAGANPGAPPYPVISVLDIHLPAPSTLLRRPRPEQPYIRRITAGMNTLIELIRAPNVRVATADLQADLRNAADQIDRMSDSVELL